MDDDGGRPHAGVIFEYIRIGTVIYADSRKGIVKDEKVVKFGEVPWQARNSLSRSEILSTQMRGGRLSFLLRRENGMIRTQK